MKGILFLLISVILFAGLAHAQLRLTETGGGAEYVGFQAPAAITTNKTWILPSTDGSANQCLATDGAANLSWITPMTSASGFANGGNSFGAATSIGTNDVQNLGFRSNNAVRMTLDTSGNVGIGTTSPAARLDVKIAAAANVGMIVRAAASQTGNMVELRDSADALLGSIAPNGSINFPTLDTQYIGATLFGNSMRQRTVTTTGQFMIESSGNMYLTGGNVGIGTSTPAEKLDVNGGIKLGSTTGANAGTLRWNGSNFQGYDGVSWFNIMPNPPAAGGCDQTQTFSNAGTHGYTVPAGYATLTIKVWGGGGAGGSGQTTNGGSGGSSGISSLGLTANGGTGGLGYWNPGGTGGSASGGTTNTAGANGTASGSATSGAGGNSPNGGSGGPAVTSLFTVGNAGNAPGGGGGGGADYQDASRGSGGGAGAYTEKTYTTATLPVGTAINDIVVGIGGAPGAASGWIGGAGGVGRVSFICSTTGSPPANNRGILFLNSGAYTTNSTFVYDSSGRVGIGTTAPEATLDVNGSVKIGSNGTILANSLVTCSFASTNATSTAGTCTGATASNKCVCTMSVANTTATSYIQKAVAGTNAVTITWSAATGGTAGNTSCICF